MTTWLRVKDQNKPWSIETCKSSSSNHEEVQISVKKPQHMPERKSDGRLINDTPVNREILGHISWKRLELICKPMKTSSGK